MVLKHHVCLLFIVSWHTILDYRYFCNVSSEMELPVSLSDILVKQFHEGTPLLRFQFLWCLSFVICSHFPLHICVVCLLECTFHFFTSFTSFHVWSISTSMLCFLLVRLKELHFYTLCNSILMFRIYHLLFSYLFCSRWECLYAVFKFDTSNHFYKRCVKKQTEWENNWFYKRY